MTTKLDDLEQAAYLIVMETPRRSDKHTSYVRRELITMLEMALRGRGVNVDAGLAHMRRWRRQQKAKHDAFMAAHSESESEEAQAKRRAEYRAAMKARGLPR